MNKNVYYKCEGCGLTFPGEKLVLNNDLELTCDECIEEAKKDKRVRNMLFLVCVFIAGSLAAFVYNIFLK